MIGSRLQLNFANAAAGITGEINLFRALIASFNALGEDALAHEYHGNKHQVIFNAMRGAGRPIPRCELCDVMIIQYSAGNANTARVTFNQVKVTNNVLGCSRPNTAAAPESFSANLEQWDLLSNRPAIRAATTAYDPPSDLLSAALLPSVGTFGVFYPSGTGFDFAYYIASDLAPLTNNPGKSGTLQWQTSQQIITHPTGHDEITGTCCLWTFGEALDYGLIGTPIWPLLYNTNGDQRMRAWLKEVLSDLRIKNPESSLPDELLSGLELKNARDDREPFSPNTPPSMPRAVILLRT
jgi:hypothetical protein